MNRDAEAILRDLLPFGTTYRTDQDLVALAYQQAARDDLARDGEF